MEAIVAANDALMDTAGQNLGLCSSEGPLYFPDLWLCRLAFPLHTQQGFDHCASLP